MMSRRLRSASDFTECPWHDCPYYGKLDEGGHKCDDKQVAVCQCIRAHKAAREEARQDAEGEA